VTEGDRARGAASLAAEIRLRLGRLDLDVELAVAPGQVLALLGPNGAGKTTVLRVLAGLQGVDGGRVSVDGAVVDDPADGSFVQPEARPVGVVFQDYLLFPHLSVLENVAFGPRARGTAKGAARKVAQQWIERVGLAEHAAAKPAAISGGQAQRAALARALATGPRLLLLDEPLAALDAATAASVRRDLRRHLAAFDGATVLVSHDPLDALALADTVAVIEDGRITQHGSIGEVTARPRTPYVADLLGVNLLRGTGAGHMVTLDGSTTTVTVADPAEGPTLLLVRPQAVALHRGEPETSARNAWRCAVNGFDLLGDHVRVRLQGPLDLVADLTPTSVAALDLVEGSTVWASVKATDVTHYPA
jgi:molybdate transport system ATP-binding protein